MAVTEQEPDRKTDPFPRDGLVRALAPGIEIREGDGGDGGDGDGGGDSQPTMEGHFSVFNEWTEIDSFFEGNFMERISPGSFKKTFREQRDSMRVLFQHGRDPSIGNKVLGSIADVREDSTGAFYTVPLFDTSYVRDLIPGLKAGQYGSSFRFRVMKEEVSMEPRASATNPKALPERTIKEVQVMEFGPVTFPAYASATAGIRSLTDDFLSESERIALFEAAGIDHRTGQPLDPTERVGVASYGGFNVPDEGLPASSVPSEDEQLETVFAEAAREDFAENSTTVWLADEQITATASAPNVTLTTNTTNVTTSDREHSDQEPGDAPTPEDGAARDDDPDSALSDGAGASHSEPTSRAPADDQPVVTNERSSPMPVIEELEARKSEVTARLQEITAENPGVTLEPALRDEWDALTAEHKELVSAIREDAERREFLADAARDEGRRVEPASPRDRTAYMRPTRSQLPADIFAVEEYRMLARDADDLPVLYREGAMRAVDVTTFPHPRARREDVQEHIARLLDRDTEGEIAKRILATGRPAYTRAFGKMWAGLPLSPEEQRALSLTTTAGGFAVPYQLDPTIIPTSNGSVNPFRQIARVESVTSNEWRGVTSAGVIANYRAEGAETTDDAPTLGQPTANPERADVFIPFSVEVGQDWGGLQVEMARLVQDAKDDLEADKFVNGIGHAANQPEGLYTGATAVVATAAATTLARGDVYGLDTALPPRFRPRASIVGNRLQYSRVRQLDTAGGADLWIRIGDGLRNSQTGALGEALLGYPTYEASAMTSALTSGASIITIGDFTNFLIADRVGMNAEVIPHLLGSNRRPTLQRGLVFWWRNTSKVLAWQAFRTLKVT